MSCSDKSTSLNLLTLKKSLYLDEVRESIPKPKGTTPNFGLPKWQNMPLESKIPMIPGLQENVYVLSRRKLGESLWLDYVDRKRFDTSDPNSYDIRLPYEGLHDPHLSQFFIDRDSVRNSIIKMGLVTQELDVKCSLREYNAYRNYLRMMHGKLVKKELERRDEMYKERLMLDVATNLALKKKESLMKNEIRKNLMNELKQQRENKIQELLQKQKDNEVRVKALKEQQKHASLKRKTESRLKNDYFKFKRAVMAKKEQQKILNTLNKWNERDYRLEKTKEQQMTKQYKDRINAALNRFEAKKKQQEEFMEREMFLKECAEKLKNSFIMEYDRKVNRSRRKLQELLAEKKRALKKSFMVKKKTKNPDLCRCKEK